MKTYRYIFIYELRSKLCSWGIGHVQTGWSPIGCEGFELLEFSLSEMIKVSEAVPLWWSADLLSTLGCLLAVCFLELVLVLLCGLILSTQALAWVFPAGAGIVCVCLLALPLCSCCTCPSRSMKQVKHSTIHG